MPPVLRIDPELGRMIRTAREKRGWSRTTLAAMVGPVGSPPKGLRDNQIVRWEAGKSNLTADAAWRLADLFWELDPFALLVGAGLVSPESSEDFKQAVRAEAERRRRGEVPGYRGYDLALAAAVADASADQQDHTTFGSWDRAAQELTAA